ncbi:MAG: ABC transporter permease [Chloroflexi bacterium RBG_16_54_11]|nr:MAG: ABC transporter permease [Chloroflexi bacterium RBG_16_54_11]
MLGSLLQAAIIVNILASTIRIATPLLLGAMGELVSERSGVMNLGIEGTMLMSSYVAFLVDFQTNSIILAILAAMLTGAIMSLIMAFMASTLKVDQTVTGLALNLLASGISLFWYRVAFKGTSTESIPTIQTMGTVKLPLLGDLPYLGEIFFSQGLLTYLAFLMVPVIAFVLYRTHTGLAIRSLGENPRAVDMKGINVTRLQYMSVIFGGVMSGLAGSFITIGTTVRFLPEISAGRGWLALVIVIAGNWRAGRILLATLLFAFLDAFQLQLQGIGIQFPFQILLAAPYILAVVVLMSSRARSQAPKHLGMPYMREEG